VSHLHLEIPFIENQSVVKVLSVASLFLGGLYVLLCIGILFVKKKNESEIAIKERNFYPYIIIGLIILVLIFWAGKSGFVINKNTQNEFIRAAEDGNIVKIRSLIKKGVDVDTIGYPYSNFDPATALIEASEDGRIEIVRELIKDGANINIERGSDGWTALLCASRYGHTEIVDELIKAGADVNTKHRGYSAIITAAIGNNSEVVKQFIKAGADVNSPDWFGKTAIDYARQNNNSEMVEELIAAGAR